MKSREEMAALIEELQRENERLCDMLTTSDRGYLFHLIETLRGERTELQRENQRLITLGVFDRDASDDLREQIGDLQRLVRWLWEEDWPDTATDLAPDSLRPVLEAALAAQESAT